MANQKGGFTNRAPMFNGMNCVFWKVRMKSYIQSLGADVWDIVKEEYQNTPTMIIRDHKTRFTCNAKAMNALLAGLPKS